MRTIADAFGARHVVLAVAIVIALTACGGDGGDGGAGADTEAPAGDATSDQAAEDEDAAGEAAAGDAGTGEGMFTADGTTYEFTADEYCTVFADPEKGFASVRGSTADGVPVQITMREDDDGPVGRMVQVGEESGDEVFFLAQAGEQSAGSIDSYSIDGTEVSGTVKAVAGLGGGGLGNTVELTFEATCGG